MATKNYDFGTLRLKRDTLNVLKGLKDAYETSYDKKMTMDEFILQVVSSVERCEPLLWEIYQKIKESQEELARLAEESRRNREIQ